MPFHTEVMVVLMVFMTVEIAVEIAVHTVITVVWIVFSTEETAVEMAVQMVLKVVWILARTVVKKLETAVNTVVATDWIAETVFEKKLLIPLHTVSKKLLILPQTVCQSIQTSHLPRCWRRYLSPLPMHRSSCRRTHWKRHQTDPVRYPERHRGW